MKISFQKISKFQFSSRIFLSRAGRKRSQAEPSRTENFSARAMAWYVPGIYNFVKQERMTKGVEENEFLDVGSEQETFLYGTTFTSVRDVMSENKLCVIDCRPEVCNSNSILQNWAF